MICEITLSILENSKIEIIVRGGWIFITVAQMDKLNSGNI